MTDNSSTFSFRFPQKKGFFFHTFLNNCLILGHVCHDLFPYLSLLWAGQWVQPVFVALPPILISTMPL